MLQQYLTNSSTLQLRNSLQCIINYVSFYTHWLLYDITREVNPFYDIIPAMELKSVWLQGLITICGSFNDAISISDDRPI